MIRPHKTKESSRALKKSKAHTNMENLVRVDRFKFDVMGSIEQDATHWDPWQSEYNRRIGRKPGKYTLSTVEGGKIIKSEEKDVLTVSAERYLETLSIDYLSTVFKKWSDSKFEVATSEKVASGHKEMPQRLYYDDIEGNEWYSTAQTFTNEDFIGDIDYQVLKLPLDGFFSVDEKNRKMLSNLNHIYHPRKCGVGSIRHPKGWVYLNATDGLWSKLDPLVMYASEWLFGKGCSKDFQGEVLYNHKDQQMDISFSSKQKKAGISFVFHPSDPVRAKVVDERNILRTKNLTNEEIQEMAKRAEEAVEEMKAYEKKYKSPAEKLDSPQWEIKVDRSYYDGEYDEKIHE